MGTKWGQAQVAGSSGMHSSKTGVAHVPLPWMWDGSGRREGCKGDTDRPGQRGPQVAHVAMSSVRAANANVSPTPRLHPHHACSPLQAIVPLQCPVSHPTQPHPPLLHTHPLLAPVFTSARHSAPPVPCNRPNPPSPPLIPSAPPTRAPLLTSPGRSVAPVPCAVLSLSSCPTVTAPPPHTQGRPGSAATCWSGGEGVMAGGKGGSGLVSKRASGMWECRG